MVESLSKLVAAGFEHEKAYLSFQEYFEKLRDEPERWGKPMAAVLGALMAQVDLGAGAIGGKDSMSGSFEQLDVPPTLICFAVAVGNMSAPPPRVQGRHTPCRPYRPALPKADGLPRDAAAAGGVCAVEELDEGNALAVSTPGYGAAPRRVQDVRRQPDRHELAEDIDVDDLFTPLYGCFIVELAEDAELPEVVRPGVVGELLGTTAEGYVMAAGRGRSSSPSCRRRGRAASRASSPTAAPARPPRSRPSTSAPRISTCTAAPRSPARA